MAYTKKEDRKKYYQNNKKKILKKQNLKREKIRQYIRDYKLFKGCSVCGYNKCSAALDFHHEGEKELNISKAIANRRSLKIIKEEMEKCVVLCANCHREIHSKK